MYKKQTQPRQKSTSPFGRQKGLLVRSLTSTHKSNTLEQGMNRNVTIIEVKFKKSDKNTSHNYLFEDECINKLPLNEESIIPDNTPIPNLHLEESPQTTAE